MTFEPETPAGHQKYQHSDCSLLSNKNFIEILPSNGLSPGPGEVGQGGLQVFHLWLHSQKKQLSPTKKFFFECRLKDLPCLWAFEQLPTTFSARVTCAQRHVWSGCFAARILDSCRMPKC